MKKKAIEAVPYITIPGIVRNKNVKYVAVTAWENIAGERHIMLEVYKNRKKSLQIPVVRYVATKKAWGVYFPDTDTWTGESIHKYGTLCWRKKDWGERWMEAEENILLTAADLDRITHFFKEERAYRDLEWWDYFENNERSIRCNTSERKRRAREERLQERIKDTPALKQQEILKWASRRAIFSTHYMYYKKRGKYADICCSACGVVTYGKWKRGNSYENSFEKIITEPVENGIGYCPACGAFGTYKPQGRAKIKHEIKDSVFMTDRYHDSGVVLRYIKVYKVYTLITDWQDDGSQTMAGAYESMQGIEIARTYFESGKKVQTDYFKHNPYTGKDFWDDCNLYGLNNIVIGEAMIHPDTWESLKGTFLQYSAIKEYTEEKVRINAKDYLERYMEWPQIEMLVKMKLFGIVEGMVKGYCGVIADKNARRPEEFLGIRKERIKLLASNSGDVKMLKILQLEKRMGQNWTEDQVMAFMEIGADRNQLERALGIITAQKLINYISGYAGCGYGTKCITATDRLKMMAGTYFDYLDMRAQLGYDMTNTVYQKPRNLGKAHNKMVMEINKKEQDERLRLVEQKYPEIREHYRKLRKQYFYKDDDYVIRPARSAAEIVMEGRTLHHCVGSDTYLQKHSTGRSAILMLRYRSEPDMPYITVEIKDEHIIQWYGAHDKKPDKENMQKWLDRYTAMLECRRMGTTLPAEQETAQLLAYA